MKKLFLALVLLCSITFLHAQTCVGTLHFELFNSKTKKPITEKLQKTIVYAFTMDEMEFYQDVQPVVPIDSVMKNKKVFKVKVNEKGYDFFQSTDPASVDFATHCGLYLVHMDFYGKNDTMSLGIYNIPAHQSFQIDSVPFQKGKYFIDFQASERLHNFKFLDDKGYFQVPSDEVKPFAKKEGE